MTNEEKEDLEYKIQLRDIKIYELNNRIKELEEINEEHRKENGKLREQLLGKSIREMGVSDLYGSK